MKLRQAILTRSDDPDYITATMRWIPSRLCKKGKLLQDKNGKVWKVGEAFNLEIDSDEIETEWKVGGLT